jgi:hypothetical protein
VAYRSFFCLVLTCSGKGDRTFVILFVKVIDRGRYLPEGRDLLRRFAHAVARYG